MASNSPRSPTQIRNRVEMMRTRCLPRDLDYDKIIAMRRGDYNRVAPGLFNTSEFEKPLIANLVDTMARDIAEVMAPMPKVDCQPASMSNETDSKRQDIRSCIANDYLQVSRLQNQMFGGADRYGSFGFMAYIATPDFDERMPVVRVDDVATAYYTNDYLGRTKEYAAVYKVYLGVLRAQFPNVPELFRGRYGGSSDDNMLVEVVRWYDADQIALQLMDPAVTLGYVQNRLGRCPVRLVERPSITGETRGQFDDVIWVQVARALVQMYTMNALEQSVNAPVVLPNDVQEFEVGPFAVLQTENPQGVGRVQLNLSPGLFPQQQMLQQEQQQGSRYPEGRSGTIDASVVTGQGVQALMGTFDTQIQTFQRLNASALEDVIAMCFEIDEMYFGDLTKIRRIRDNGAPRKYTYTPRKDIAGDHTVDVSYGAIAGLDPNRGLVFVLQALAGGLITKSTARKSLPVDLNVVAEEQAINLEKIDDSIAATLAAIPQAIAGMAMQGQDPRQVALQVAQIRDLVAKGKGVAEAMSQVFAPKLDEQQEQQMSQAAQMQQALQAAQSSAPPGGAPSGASAMLMGLAGMTPSGNPNLQANLSTMTPAAGQ